MTSPLRLFERLNKNPPTNKLLEDGSETIKNYIAANTVAIDLKYVT